MQHRCNSSLQKMFMYVIQVKFVDLLNYFPYTLYQFELKECVSRTYANETVGVFWGFVWRIYVD